MPTSREVRTNSSIVLSALAECNRLDTKDIRDLLFSERSLDWVNDLVYRMQEHGEVRIRLLPDGYRHGILQTRKIAYLGEWQND